MQLLWIWLTKVVPRSEFLDPTAALDHREGGEVGAR